MDSTITAKVMWTQGDRFNAAFYIHPGRPVVQLWGRIPNTPSSPLGRLIASRGRGTLTVVLDSEAGENELVPRFVKDNGVHVPLYESPADIR